MGRRARRGRRWRSVAVGWGPKTLKKERSCGLKGGLKPALRERRPNLRLCEFSAASVRLFLRVCVFCSVCFALNGGGGGGGVEASPSCSR